jgi:hypothetical protein
VKSLLQGKIRFTDDPADVNKFQNSLLNDLIAEAEGQVEMDLSERYMAPFQTDSGQPFQNLPMRPTLLYLATMSELLSSIRVLETDFGRAMIEGGDKYASVQQKRYDAMVEKLVARKKFNGEETLEWKYPPLPSLRLNWHNTEADDGYMGRVLVTSEGRGGFPADQINSPSENFWNGNIDPLGHNKGGGEWDW